MSVPPVVRPRRPEDVPRLVEILVEQRPSSHYPMRWPLPFPAEEFVVRPHEEVAWVAEAAHGERPGDVLGHVMVGRVEGEEAELFTAVTGRTDLALVSVLFTSLAARGTGTGGLLLDTAVAHIEASGRLPVLDVVPRHAEAFALYQRRGWRDVARMRPDWLPAGEEDLVLMVLDRAGPS